MTRMIPLGPRALPALVDDEDYDRVVAAGPWHASKRGATYYARHNERKPEGGYRSYSMHQIVLDPSPGLEIDHINGDGLDNRRGNLRAATRSQNNANRNKRSSATSSRFKGVIFVPAHWEANINAQGRQHYLGRFDSEEAAARAYDEAAVMLHGEYAKVNFPEVM